MKTWVGRFNTYLLVTSWLIGWGGLPAWAATNSEPAVTNSAATTKKAGSQAPKKPKATPKDKQRKKDMSTLRLHLESNLVGTDRTINIQVLRESPVRLVVEKDASLDEGEIDRASLVESGDSHLIRVHYNKRGTWMLMNLTSTHLGKRLAIMCQFPEGRWLAAPLIQRPLADGVLTFTPDATREESQRIVDGLNNVAAEVKKKFTF